MTVGIQPKLTIITVTQFEEAHARKAFPCFDRPDFKATFDVEFVLDKNLTGISNMPIQKDIPWLESEDKKLVKFNLCGCCPRFFLPRVAHMGFLPSGNNSRGAQPGHPLITAKREGQEIHLHQERFFYLGRKEQAKWMIPLFIQVWDAEGRSEVFKHIMNDAEERISLKNTVSTFKINPGQTGFYRVKYSDGDWDTLGPLIKNKTLSGVDRFGLQEDLFALVRRADIPVSRYLGHVSHEPGKTAGSPKEIEFHCSL